MRVVAESGRVIKAATSDGEEARLAAEARVLAAAAHPGVVRLIELRGGNPPTELVLAEVRGTPLSAIERRLDWAEVAGLGAAVATTLADLHDIGVIHRAVTSEHIIVDPAGRPVLCGFGRAVLCHQLSEARSRSLQDVEALAELLLCLGDASPPRALARLLRSCIDSRPSLRATTARRLAHGLVRAVPGARLPGSEPPEAVSADSNRADRGSRADRPSARSRLPALVTLVVAVSVVVLALNSQVGGHARGARPCPVVDEGCTSHQVRSGSVIISPTGKFMLIGTSGIETVGRWRCSPVPLPVVLDRHGDVWTFERWPIDPSGNVAHLLGKVSGAANLKVVPGSGRWSGCDSLLVERRGLKPVTFNFAPS